MLQKLIALMFLAYVGDIFLMLVTKFGDKITLRSLLSLSSTFMSRDRGLAKTPKAIATISNLSSTHFDSNIRHQYRCSQ